MSNFVNDYAIRAEGLSKKYIIGARGQRYDTLREAITQGMIAPYRRLRKMHGRPAANEAVWALKNVSFQINRGEVVGIIGRNGAGKSTLLKILSRITEPSEGRAAVRGRLASLLEVGTGFHSELTGRENIFLNGAILGMSRGEIQQKFDEIVAFAEIDKFIETPVKKYSSGMYVRLAFAVAAHLEPEVLLVDEVLAVGDAAFQRKSLGRMNTVAKQGRTILLVTHQMNQIRNLCSQCIWLDGGTVRMSGSSPDVIGAYEASLASRSGEAVRADRNNTDAEFIGWCIPTANAERNNMIVSHDSVSIRFSIKVNKRLGNAHHGILLYDNSNQIIWSAGADNLVLEPGIREFYYDFPSLPLRPGKYSWFVSLWNNGSQIEELHCYPPLIIATPSYMHPSDHLQGVLNTKYKLQVR
jgi:homopolymeric O-antigen transport system ATP-binding protein